MKPFDFSCRCDDIDQRQTSDGKWKMENESARVIKIPFNISTIKLHPEKKATRTKTEHTLRICRARKVLRRSRCRRSSYFRLMHFPLLPVYLDELLSLRIFLLFFSSSSLLPSSVDHFWCRDLSPTKFDFRSLVVYFSFCCRWHSSQSQRWNKSI